MTLATQLLKAQHIGSKDLRQNLAYSIRSAKPVVITEHGQPRQVLMPYKMMLDLIEIVEDIQDRELNALVQEGKKVIEAAGSGIPVGASFKKIRAARKV